ncbi:MAG TPA: putative Ig domain-containing protein [Thermoanaerobaculia bacterium]|nr:putative Ig domain-containing protein [Thermoanaerobaculia bacterium]
MLAGTSIRSEGATRITGNVGVSPGHQIAGLSANAVRIGTIVDERTARDAQSDAAAAVALLGAMPCSATPAALAGTLEPGVHCFDADVELTGTLFLDAVGDRDALWVFRVRGKLTTAPDSAVRVIDGGSAGNVFWDAEEVSLGPRTAFAGNILARTHIAFESGASLSGRALARTGAVTLDGNEISLCCGPITLAPATLPNGVVSVEYTAPRIAASGGLAPYTFAAASLPPGLSLSRDGLLTGVPTLRGTFPFSVTATDGQGCTGTAVYTIAIACEELPDATEGAEYSAILAPEATCVATSALPPGLTLVGCTLAGIPREPGRFDFTIVSGTRILCFTLDVAACPIAFLPPDVPDGTACIPFSHTIATSDCTDCAITAPDALLPPGLSLSSAGVLSGTPILPGTFTFPVTARDETCARTREITMAVACRVIAPPPERLPDGTVGSMYAEALRRGECPGKHTFVPGPLPPGLIVDGDGVLRGTPSDDGTFAFTVASTAANGCTATHSYVVDIDCPPIALAPATLPPATVGVSYEATLTASGAIGPYTFSSSPLPADLMLAADGKITGTPAAAGVFAFSVTARDTVSGCEGTRQYELLVGGCPTLTIGPAVLPNATVTVPYSETFTVAGGTPPYAFAVVSGALPPGLTLSGSGTLAGTPTATGTFSFMLEVTDAAGCKDVLVFCAIDVHESDCPLDTVITLAPAALPPAAPDEPYGPYAIVAAGGTPPYTLTVTSGALPPGLTLVGGILSGTPTATGTFTFTVTATDDNGCRGSLCYTLQVSTAIPTLPEWALLALLIVLAAAGLTVLGGRHA